jgi:predicted transposase YdaD
MAKRKNRKVTARKNYNTGNHPAANRKYKDTVFRMLFSDRKNLLSLYNAVNGSSYEDPDALEIVTLENAVYMGMKNDLAFIVDTGLFLYEHQSTYNPNMPLRDLFYIAGKYQKLVDHRSLYSSSIQKIPAPNFLVFYNGTERKEDSWVSYLSESYENLTGEPNLELKVLTLNINEGHNSQLLEQCQILREYAQYVAKVREYAGTTDLDTAVEQAVNDCIQNGILAEFLRKNKSEVIAMSIFEYDKEEEERKLRKAEYEAGREAGIKVGREAGLKVGREAGLKEGIQEIVQNMLRAGETPEKIARYTGCEIQELEKLLEQKSK